MPVEVFKAFENKFDVRILEGYGLSETSPLATFNQFEKPSKAGTVGQAIFGVEVRCVDENDAEVPTGTRGEIVIRGSNVMKGYYKRPAATAEAFQKRLVSHAATSAFSMRMAISPSLTAKKI